MHPVFIKTFGCKVNYAESTAFADLLRGAGFTPLEVGSAQLPGADEVEQPVVFVNGCCVTAEAERKAAQYVRAVRRRHPGAEVLLCGCAARNYATRRSYELAGARVFSFYPEAFDWVRQHVQAPVPFAAPAAADAIAQPQRARAFLKVQDGCHNCCTFCIIPFVRPYASRPLPELLAEARRRLDEGLRELVLTGVNIGHYGMTPIAGVQEIASATHFKRSRLYEPVPGHPRLPDLIEALLELLQQHARSSGRPARLRISSIEPEDIEPRFFSLFAHPQLCPHLHLPLQSGSPRVLAAMRRLYDLETYMQRVAAFRGACPHGALTTDVLVGFPGETEDDFAQTLAACEQAGFERIHGFPFSPRPGTRAALLPQLAPGVAAERNRRLLQFASGLAQARWRSWLGRTAAVLVEGRQGQLWRGYGEAYQDVRISAPPEAQLSGQLLQVKLAELQGGVFTGRAGAAEPQQQDAAAGLPRVTVR